MPTGCSIKNESRVKQTQFAGFIIELCHYFSVMTFKKTPRAVHSGSRPMTEHHLKNSLEVFFIFPVIFPLTFEREEDSVAQ